jgi:micrococcal nuclease
MKKRKRNEKILLILLILALFAVNYTFLDQSVQNFMIDRETFFVERIVDGDTIVANGENIRLLGINTPERGEEYYDEAKQYLSDLVLNKTVELEFGPERRDKYGRLLAYVYEGETLVNKEMVYQGYANIYFPSGKDNHYNSFLKLWRDCIEQNHNLCEESAYVFAHCIELKEISSLTQEVVFHNKCERGYDITNWIIKGESRKKFIIPTFKIKAYSDFTLKVGEGNSDQENQILYWTNEDQVWTSTGDSLFLRDDKNKLVLWDSY